GVFVDQLNYGHDYNLVRQFVEVPTLFSSTNLAYRIPTTRIRQNYNIGAILDKQQFNSHIDGEIRGNLQRILNDSLANQMNWNRYSLTAEAQYDWSKKRFSIQLNVPLTLQFTNYADVGFNIDENTQHLLFLPS